MLHRTPVLSSVIVLLFFAAFTGCQTTKTAEQTKTHEMEIAENLYIQYATNQGDLAMERRDFKTASHYYDSALRLRPQDERLARLRETAEIEKEKLTAPNLLLDRYTQQLRIRRQAVLNEAATWLHEARLARARGDFNEAKDLTAQAMMTLEKNKELF